MLNIRMILRRGKNITCHNSRSIIIHGIGASVVMVVGA